MKSRYQERLVVQLSEKIVEAQAAFENGEAAALSPSDFVLLAQQLSRIDLTPEQFGSVADQIDTFTCRHYPSIYSPSVDDLANLIIVWLWAALDHRAQLRAQFEQYAVDAASVADFMARYCKPDRYTNLTEFTNWDAKYAVNLLASQEADFAKDGYISIGEHESVTGRTVSLMRLTPPGDPT